MYVTPQYMNLTIKRVITFKDLNHMIFHFHSIRQKFIREFKIFQSYL